jgi:hypothetical protein
MNKYLKLMKVAVDIIKVNKFSQTMFSWDMPKWAYDMRISRVE